MAPARVLLWGAAFAVACSSSESNPGAVGCQGSHCDAGSDTPHPNGGAKPTGGSAGMSASGAGGGVMETGGAGGAMHRLDASASGGTETGDGGDASIGPAPEAAACPTGFGDCNHRPEDGCETSLLGHPNHCGKCERDCLGAECHEGLCDAIQLSTGNVGDIAVGGGNVYWIEGDAVRAASRDGGNLQSISRPEGTASFIAIGGADIYWTNLGNAYFPNSFANPGLVRVAPVEDSDGGGPRTLYTGFVQQPVFELAGGITTDDKNVYFGVDDRSGSGSAYFKAPLGGGTPQRLFPDTGYLQKIDVQYLRAAKGYLFGAGGLVEALQGIRAGGWLFRIGIDDGSYLKLWQSDTVPAISLDDYGDYVYVTAAASEAIVPDSGAPDSGALPLRLFRVPMKGGPPEFLWDGGGVGIAVDDTGIYAGTDQSLERFDLSGGPPTVLVTDQSPRVIATDDKAVYWANFDPRHGLWKVAK